MTRCLLTAGLLVASAGFNAARAAAQDGEGVDAVAGIAAAFEKHPVVIIAEARHGLRQMGDLYIRLVRDPAFQHAVQDIVIEFASRQNQLLLDRYTGGEDVPMEEVRKIWRDTTKVASWEFPVYAEWLAAIRDVNRQLPPARRFRVWAGDTAVEWSRIHNHDDWAALGDNNLSFTEVITKQVLAKRRRCLVVLGSNHVIKSGDRNGDPNTTTRVEARYPGSTYVVLLHIAAAGSPDEKRLANSQAPALYELSGPARKVADAWLYAGPGESLTTSNPPPGSLEPVYMKEVDRRSMIEWGELRARKFLGDAVK